MGATDLSVLPQRSVVFPETVFRGLAPADVPLRVEGVVSQTGNLFEVRNSSASLLSRFQANGVLNADLNFSGENSFGGGGLGGVRLTVHTGVAAALGLVVRGAPSQTANLQSWQNSAGGTMLSVGSAGVMTFVTDNFADFGANTGWGAWLRVGGNGYTITTGSNNHASIATTNGNLHLDAARGSNAAGIYFNYYNGSAANANNGSVFFGNGTPTEVMRVNKDGSVGIGMSGSNIDARIHIRSDTPTARYIQMSPVAGTANGDTLNLIASTNGAGAEQWWSWGVGNNNVFHINTGTVLNSSPSVGLAVLPGGIITAKVARMYGGGGSTTAGSRHWGDANLMLEAVGSGMGDEHSGSRSPRVSFHVPGLVAPSIGTDASGVIKFWGTDGVGFSWGKMGTLVLGQSNDPGTGSGEGRIWMNTSGQLRYRHQNGSDYYITG